jgi:flagellar basal body-associated protein FliL
MKIKVVSLLLLIICACAVASAVVAFSFSQSVQKSAESIKQDSSVQTDGKTRIELVGEEIDTPGVPR